MKIKTITCHDVYNVGASLQAHALQQYLMNLGHDVEIINYKPEYLNKHYNLFCVNTPRYNKPILREMYILVKFPKRILALIGKRKKKFDTFRCQYMKLTSKKFTSIEELKTEPPQADVYVAGSDQIWNPLFPNGKDASFFLDFVPQNSKRMSYAASFATDAISEEDSLRMQSLLEKFDAISVREQSGVDILKKMGIAGKCVCDPVFLLVKDYWDDIAITFDETKYLFLYDFDKNQELEKKAKRIAEKRNLKIYSFFKSKVADKSFENEGPREFVGLIKNADIVISNSFHATAFALIYEKPFYVIDRMEKINSRMNDLIKELGLKQENDFIDYQNVNEILKKKIIYSKEFLNNNLIKER